MNTTKNAFTPPTEASTDSCGRLTVVVRCTASEVAESVTEARVVGVGASAGGTGETEARSRFALKDDGGEEEEEDDEEEEEEEEEGGTSGIMLVPVLFE